jgi:hypothetical protein
LGAVHHLEYEREVKDTKRYVVSTATPKNNNERRVILLDFYCGPNGNFVDAAVVEVGVVGYGTIATEQLQLPFARR